MTYGFELDEFQRRAMSALDEGSSVLVAAPTGSGKTVVAEHAIDLGLARGAKSFYTTPIKALSNQKFHDLAHRLGPDDVGLLTGDNSVNPQAPVVVMTTEVLRNMIYARSAALDGLRYVVLDEVHYLQDAYRGPVWEEVIIHLATDVVLVCLSATVSNAEELAGWLREVRGPTTVVVEEKRPVLLENLYVAEDRRADELVVVPTLKGGRPNPVGRRFDHDPLSKGSWRKRRYGPPARVDVVELMAEREMVPAIYFIFSRAGCDDAVRSCLRSGLRMTRPDERDRVRQIVEAHVGDLSDDDLSVLGYGRWLAGLEAGFGAHHAGLVPPFKEAVEACFLEGLVKVVFATETLALGINMPARSVVIEKLTKFTGERHEFLTPAQYTQLTGRAGRRGIDEEGSALVLWSPFVRFDEVARLAASNRFALRSSFRPTYNMAANLVRRYTEDEAHRLLRLSFAQYQADAARADRQGGSDARRARRRSRQAASLVDRFDRIIELLGGWGYVEDWVLTERGEGLVRIYHESDLLIAESLEAGALDGLDPAALAGLASCFTYEHRSSAPPADPWFPSRSALGSFEEIGRICRRLNEDEIALGLPPTRAPDPGFVALAHAWAAGEPFEEVLGDEELSGGDFVRNVKQLLDLLRQLGEAAGDPATAATARAAADAMFRGVVAASSAISPSGESVAHAEQELEGEGHWGEGVDDDLPGEEGFDDEPAGSSGAGR